ncbi:unnamed protein product [Soboliphyme baturini]|uniref:SHSP domain-containing protein n=1 Tax=Soboliphyme baturini TaxID=241478 RepID=A0A183J1X0_9BILA|nr:unnamed protein product [Soboliphyme baturini]
MDEAKVLKQPTEQFITTIYPTVHTKRSFIRSKSNKEALSILKSWSELNKDLDKQKSRTVRLPSFGAGGYGDRFATLWEWPLGEPFIYSDEHKFEAQLCFSPFLPDQIKAKVMGNELMVHCKTDNLQATHREIFRCYQLPLNIDIGSIQFSIVDHKYLVVRASKDKPIKLALAFDASDGKSETNFNDEAYITDK